MLSQHLKNNLQNIIISIFLLPFFISTETCYFIYFLANKSSAIFHGLSFGLVDIHYLPNV